MTAAAIEPVVPGGERRSTRFAVAHDMAVVTRRNLKRIRRTPSLLAASTIQPILFVLLFRYVFGGSIHVPGVNYVDYLMPGIFINTTLFGATTAVAMASDLAGGMIDRFRSLPMARSAVLAGRCIADLIRSVLVVALILIVGTLIGFRFHNGVLPALAAMGLVLVFGFSFMWLFALVGMLVKDPETAQLASFVPLFPFLFASSIFVPVQNMPGWLQAFARNQPVSVTADTVRALSNGGPVAHVAWQSGAWIVGFIVVFSWLAVRAYRQI
ncbi:MAG: ABC transporter permease [Acidimicrobiaceae bacterium]|nr:ABC transporter permease [Acidimicrobiaceae bacterium]